MIALIKQLHMLFAFISLLGFVTRGVWMLRESPLLRQRWAKILPHVNDTLLLVSAISLAALMGLSPGAHPWLMAKIIALFVYIGLGVLAFRHPRKPVRVLAWLAALVVFMYIVSVAFSKQPLGFLG